MESYQSLYLKAYYPIEYMVATVNNGGGFYRRELYLHEARMHGAQLHAPCVNRSDWQTVVRGKDVYLGFELLESFESASGLALLKERELHGAFKSFDDFVERVPLGIEQLKILIKIGGFRFSALAKKNLLWEAHMKLGKLEVLEAAPMQRLFTDQVRHFETPEIVEAPIEDAFDQLEYLGFVLCHPFDLLVERPNGGYLAENLMDFEGQFVEVYGTYVTAKPTKTSRGEVMYFGTFLDEKGSFIDTVHFPPQAKRYPFRGRGVYKIQGKVVLEFDCISIEISALEKLDMIEDPRYRG